MTDIEVLCACFLCTIIGVAIGARLTISIFNIFVEKENGEARDG